MSEFIGKRYEYEGFIYMCLQGVTGGTELGGDIAIAVLRPIRPPSGRHLIIWYRIHLLRIRDLMWRYSFAMVILRLLNVTIVILSDHGDIYIDKINGKRIQVRD